MGRFAERRHQTAPVAGAGGKHDVARLDAVERNCGEVGMQGFSPQASRDDGDSLTGGDELELVASPRSDPQASMRGWLRRSPAAPGAVWRAQRDFSLASGGIHREYRLVP